MKKLEAASLTPRQIVAELDKYIVGQHEAKKSVAIALRNRWRRLMAHSDIREDIIPNNILLIGPTGVGKTEIARRLAKMAGAPFLKVEATKYTEVGYVGRDVESMVRDITEIAVNMVKAEMKESVQDKAAEMVEQRILDILIPPVMKSPTGFTASEATLESDAGSDQELNERTRQRFREKLRSGELDERMIELEVKTPAPMMQIFGPQGLEEMGMNLQDVLGNLGPKRTKKSQVKISEARRMLLAEEAEKLIDHDAAIHQAIDRVQQSGIIFIDEIDKIAAKSADKGGPDVSRQGVQRDLLPIVEGSTVTTKYGMVKTDHVLFIASGAFHVSKPSDLIPELQGRFPIRVEMQSLKESDFYQILTIPRNALTKQYQAMLSSEGLSLEFTDEALKEVARLAAEVNASIENIGARRLNTILSTILEEILFQIPDDKPEGSIVIDKAYVDERLSSLIRNRDLSHYIL
jgi:ATP-dependent HslUV protease ATP-binding subunit HslU